MTVFFDYILLFLTELWAQLRYAPNPIISGFVLLINGLWIPVVVILLKSAKIVWQDWRQAVFHVKNRTFILLAIDVPRNNEQSPKAVENIFSHLHGILPGTNNKWEDWWVGKTPDFFSVELVSIEGYVQFLVYTQPEYRDMVESAFYAQYPDSEITQVEDYAFGQDGEFKNLTFPNKEYEMYGCEFKQMKNFAYPIKLHMDFEHALSQEFKDPMASLLENMNKIGPGEQFWFQIVITPEYDYNWQPQASRVAMKIAGKDSMPPANKIDKTVSVLVTWLDALAIAVFPFYNQTEETSKKDEMPSLMLHLTPMEQNQVQAIQMKADKLGFWCKFRYLYIAKKEIAAKARGLAPIMGSIKQFTSLNMNGLIPHKYTKTWGLDYVMVGWRIAQRQNKLIRAFQDRARSDGSNGIILNTEELATLYHFPTEVVKAPLVSRTQSKRSSAPVSLPIESAPRTLRTALDDQELPSSPAEQTYNNEQIQEQDQAPQPQVPAVGERPRTGSFPGNLPYV